ncbi:MAG: hypothetical protein JO085_03700 [Acidimicrobiia bacterium]|nr:hypothetical protein [Acidimicrobiia bacterium]
MATKPPPLYRGAPEQIVTPYAEPDPLMGASASIFARSSALSERVARTRAQSRVVRQQAWEHRLRSKAIRDQSAALKERFDDGVLGATPDDGVPWFSLAGVLGDRNVWARWAHGSLRCHPDLMTQARLLVELGTVFEHHDPPARVEATVTGAPAAVMMTLARACDRVVVVDFPRTSPL